MTITRGEASLKATFLAPPGVQIRKSSGTLKADAPSNVPDVDRPVLLASGDDERSGEFFVVMTLSRGQPPEVEQRGRGLEAVGTMGRQSIRFDGEKILPGGA